MIFAGHHACNVPFVRHFFMFFMFEFFPASSVLYIDTLFLAFCLLIYPLELFPQIFYSPNRLNMAMP